MGRIKIKENFVLKRVCGCYIVMPTGKNVKDFNGALILNETGGLIYEQLQQEKSIEEISDILFAEYDVTIEDAIEDVKRVIELLKEADIIEE